MIVLLGLVALVGYGFAMLFAMLGASSDLAWVASAGFATCGTVAMAGAAVCERIDALKPKQQSDTKDSVHQPNLKVSEIDAG